MITIRAESAADAKAIEQVIVAAFLNAPHTSHTEQRIVDALRRAGALTVSLVAEAMGAVIGHVALSPVVISDGAAGWYGLGPISVLPYHQRQGVGSQLLRTALQALRESGASGCVVLGDPAYYRRFGFQPVHDLVLSGVAAEYFQALSFAATPRGTVVYHPAFNA